MPALKNAMPADQAAILTRFQMSIPGLFEGAVLKLLAKLPEQRYQSATEMLAELERIGKFQGVTA